MSAVPGRSLWDDTLPDDERANGESLRSGALGELAVDVAIVGGGYTGLWTAWHLLRRAPDCRVAVFERDTVGAGASGRNGGWCSALLPMSLTAIAGEHGERAATRMQRAMHDNLTEIEAFVRDRGPAEVLHRGGTVQLARTRPQVTRLRAGVDEMRRFGFGPDDYRWVEADEAASIARPTATLGAVATPHCAAVHPLRLVHAVGRAVIAAGGRVYEHADVASIEPGAIQVNGERVRADAIIRATEAYACEQRRQRRSVLPIYSLMIATAPLDLSVWARIGLDGRPTFTDGRRLLVYGQRTADDRLAFGGRGAPYHFGSAIDPTFDVDERIRTLLIEALVDLFPVLDGFEPTHHWGGVLGAPRDWTCAVRFDRSTGLGVAGGYVGDGVATTHLAGRTLAALVTESTDDADRELTTLPWVGHHSPDWEREPLRWIGVNGARAAARRADASETRRDRPSRVWGAAVDRLLGH